MVEPTDWTYLPPTPVVKARRRPLGVVALAVSIVAVLLAGVAAVTALTGGDTNTPDQAVTDLLTAAGNADVLGVLDHIDPAERAPLTQFLSKGTADLERLGILSPGTNLNHVSGAAAVFTGVTTTSTKLRADLATVTITGGSVHLHVDPAQLPLGPFVHQHAGSVIDNAKVVDRTDPLHVSTPLATIKRGDTWYVSVGYTVAELARTKAHAAIPAAGSGVPAAGADSSTAAVDQFIRAAAALDVAKLVSLTPPDEMAALHEYAPLFLPKVQAAITNNQATLPKITITALDLKSSPAPGGGDLVQLSKLGFHATSGPTTVDLQPGAKCVTVTGTDVPAGLPGICAGSSTTTTSSAAFQGLLAPLQQLSDLHPSLGIVAVSVDGKWYVSPLRTAFDDVGAILHALTPDLLQSMAKAFSPANLFGVLGSSSSTRFSAVGSALGSGPPPAGAITSPIGSSLSHVKNPPCVNGTRTIQFPQPAGRPARPPFTIPC